MFEIPKFDKRSSRQKEVFQVQSYIMCINQHDLFLFSQPSFEKKNDTGEGVLILQNLYPIL